MSLHKYPVGLTLGCLTSERDAQGCTRTLVVRVFGAGNVLLGLTNVPVTDATNSFIGINSEAPISMINLEFIGEANRQVKSILDVRFGEKVEPRNVPTLSEWGLIAMAGVLGIIGFMVIRRRKATA
jgi:hypothetical protein